MEGDLYHQGRWFKFKLISKPSGRSHARTFMNSLSEPEVVDLLATFSILENSMRTGRGFAGRVKKIQGSKVGLIELKVGSIRLFVVVIGQTVWLADGFRKNSPQVKRYIDRAERTVSRWQE